MEESASMEMDNHVLDKEDGCYDNTEAAFSDDEEELNNKGGGVSLFAISWPLYYTFYVAHYFKGLLS